MLEELKQKVLEANLLLPQHGLVTFTWGNVSEIDREKEIVAIKPSGVEYSKMTAEDIVLIDLEGNILEGELRPSSDVDTHLEFYRNWPGIGGVVHTHSTWATGFAQAGKDIIALGTTQADYFDGAVPCTRLMTDGEIKGSYELETGKVIVDEFKRRGINPERVPGALVHSHGPFTWGSDGFNAVHNAVVLEECAKMNAIAMLVTNPEIGPMQQTLLEKHFNRKHGPGGVLWSIKIKNTIWDFMRKVCLIHFHGKEKLEVVKEAGFDYLEMSIDETEEKLARLDQPVDEMKKAIEKQEFL